MWQKKFKKERCAVMHFGANNRRYGYHLGGLSLNETTKERDLGIIVTSNLNSIEQTKCASARTTMVRIDLLFKSVRHLEFAVNQQASALVLKKE
ncbi:hypothetical protein BpHYR1_000508 [Brachionus plicatilis]|uniref:RNA-directed DNA polymerase from mobile element jockey-like n=1 Tax=Brachionus plicatilis TaxID=10195 RepID=A0A3M7R1D4_BRAPC|nr:hypothetical protein BpHYR1_000508 [Brachionus plicatilis]